MNPALRAWCVKLQAAAANQHTLARLAYGRGDPSAPMSALFARHLYFLDRCARGVEPIPTDLDSLHYGPWCEELRRERERDEVDT